MIDKNARTGLIVLAVVIGMTTLAFASVPLYNLFCRVTGFAGTTQIAAQLPDQVLEREVIVKFNADTAPQMPWIFKPDIRQVTVKIGERGLASFTAKNPADTPVAGTALYNVTPPKAGKYFHKVQCFCFDAQTLNPHETVSMPVMFFIDPKMNDDPNMNDVKVITLSYTFYEAETEELESAIQDFYNNESDGI
ncbi:MAG: cytochrome c oxidase assembly protein [Micavibrio sp.]|nr:cytochrome c oxidase assembly protein [Micavibrio sp.]